MSISFRLTNKNAYQITLKKVIVGTYVLLSAFAGDGYNLYDLQRKKV